MSVQLRSVARRRSADYAVKGIAWLAASIGIAAMVWILVTVIGRGYRAINWDFLTKLPPTPLMTHGGGLANAIVGTLLITATATVVGIPAGFFAGIYLAEYGRDGRIATAVRTVATAMIGVPSIIVGVFIYALLVKPLHHYSGYAGAAALGFIMLPVMARTAEDIINLVPNELRESALALGAPRWKAILGVVCRAARSGLLTGAILSVIRVSGETAPLLFTASNGQFWNWNMSQQMPNLTVTIWQFASQPYQHLVDIAWGGALLIIVGVLGANVLVRVLVQRGKEW